MPHSLGRQQELKTTLALPPRDGTDGIIITMDDTKAPLHQFTGDLIPHLVDKRAALTPGSTYSEYPVSTLSYDQGYRKITYRDFANAINGVARWLVETLGPAKDFETLAYIGPNDIRYPALILGAVKAGYKVCFITIYEPKLSRQC